MTDTDLLAASLGESRQHAFFKHLVNQSRLGGRACRVDGSWACLHFPSDLLQENLRETQEYQTPALKGDSVLTEMGDDGRW